MRECRVLQNCRRCSLTFNENSAIRENASSETGGCLQVSLTPDVSFAFQERESRVLRNCGQTSLAFDDGSTFRERFVWNAELLSILVSV